MALSQAPLLSEQRSKAYWFASNNWELVKRSLRHIRRDPDQLVSVTVQPVILVIAFRYFFGGAVRTGPLPARLSLP